MSALLNRHISKPSGRELLPVLKGQKNEQRGKIAQLGEQAQQSCPPLNVSNALGTVAGYGHLAYYLPDDQLPDFLEVDEHRYEYGKPLAKYEKSLTTMMRRFHNWYMETYRESGGTNALYLNTSTSMKSGSASSGR